MNWDAIGAVAELLGSFAVVVTIIFLVIQLKYNSSAVRNATVQSQNNAMMEWAMSIAQDQEFYGLYRRGLIEEGSLSREEMGRFDMIMLLAFQTNSSIYQQFQNGAMDENAWTDSLRLLQAPLDTPGGKASWRRQKHMLPDDFQRVVESRLNGARDINDL